MFSDENKIASMKGFHQHMEGNCESVLDENKPNSCISTDSTNDPNTNLNQNIKKYIFQNDNISYSLSMRLIEEKIKITVKAIKEKIDDYYYERDFSQEELKNINKVFKLCNDIKESYEYFNDLFKNEESQLSVSESDDIFIIEKKMQISKTLKIEIPKKSKNNFIHNNLIKESYIENNNNLINHKINDDVNINKNKNESSLNDIEINNKLNALEQCDKELNELIKNKFIKNGEMFGKLTEQVCKIDEMINNNSKKNEENKKMFYLLNKKRGSMSDLSDISFNSNNSNDIDGDKKIKNNLEKENFLKIFSENNSVNSENSNEKFFMKILKKKNLEKENNIKNQNNINIENKNISKANNDNNNMIKEEDEEKETYLYGDKDIEDEIKDDIDFFSSHSPSVTKGGPSYNNNNNNDSFYLNKNDKNQSQNSLIHNDNLFDNHLNLFPKKKYNNNINYIYYENDIKKKYEKNISSEWTVNNSYNMIGGLLEKSSNNNSNKKHNKQKSYTIIKKNSVECCNIDLSMGFQDKQKYINNIFSVDSKIISNYGDFDFIINYLKNKFNKEIINSIRIYRASEEGDRAEDFHRLCDGNTNIIVLIKTKNGKKFGGYTSVGFNNLNQSIEDDTAFIFSIDKREIYPNVKGKNAIESYYNLGPTFSGDCIKIYDNFLQKGGITSKMGLNYQTNEDFQINDGKKYFGVEEIEVLEFLEMKHD